ncbi:MAG: coproporphyrinogen III oxidase, partial [Christensenellaceae bacterium]|nr:coproporphyrinogen III oxidase [Christensenellaceae bacterium]
MFNDKYISIYIHIPFCLKKCFYCDFCSYTNLNKIDEYLFYLKKEAKFYSEYFKDFKVKTFFVGGGTPTILKEDQINSTFSYIFSLFNISNDSEISCEANPETLN